MTLMPSHFIQHNLQDTKEIFLMAADCSVEEKSTGGMGFFERYLTVWVGLCILGGILLGKIAPGFAKSLDEMAIYVNNAPVVSIPIALCLFFMMYPIMVKIDFGEVLRAGKSIKPVGLTLVINWAIKPFTMYAISVLFLGTLFLGFIGPDAVDYVKPPLGLELEVGAQYGVGEIVIMDGAICPLGRCRTNEWIAEEHGVPSRYSSLAIQVSQATRRPRWSMRREAGAPSSTAS